MEKTKAKPEQIGRDIGIAVAQPASACTDRHCPFHGELKVRGRIFSGSVIRDVFHKSTIIEFPRKLYIPKYERYQIRLSKIKAHNPPCINAKIGDYVKIKETRERVSLMLDEFRIHEAIISINELITFGDRYINENEIWKDTESKKEKMFNAVVLLDNVASFYQPFLPETSWNISKNIRSQYFLAQIIPVWKSFS